MRIGTKGYTETVVTKENSAAHMGSGTLEVYATPAMIALMEHAAQESVASQLDEGCCTVGTGLNIRHLSATPIGMKVRCETELVKADGKSRLDSISSL